MSDSVRPHRLQPTRLPRPWDSPGKNTGVCCHFLLQWMKVKSEREVAQLCPTLIDPNLGWEDALEKGTANHSRILAWRIPWGRKEWLSDFHFHFLFMYICISSHIFYCCYKPLPLCWAFTVLWSFPFFLNFNFLNLLLFFYVYFFVCFSYCSFPLAINL